MRAVYVNYNFHGMCVCVSDCLFSHLILFLSFSVVLSLPSTEPPAGRGRPDAAAVVASVVVQSAPLLSQRSEAN